MMDSDALLAGLPARLSDIPRRWALSAPDAPALHERGRSWTYAELDGAIAGAAALLRELDVRPGDRLMVVGENCAALVALTFAAAAADAWIVHVNGRMSAREIDAIREHCGARRAIYTVSGCADAAAHAMRHGAMAPAPGLPGVPALLGELAIGPLNEGCVPEPVYASNREQVAALVYTTGTTGAAKGVMLTHRNLLFVAAVSSALRGLTPSDRAYGVLPISHVYGLASVMLGTLSAGACLYLAPRFAPDTLLKALDEDGLTILQGVPAMYARLLESMGGAGARLPNRLRFAYAGGSPLDASLKREVEKLLGVALHNGYGLTESAPTISQTRLDAPRADTSVGLAIPGVELRLCGRDGAGVAHGEAGQLWVRGPNVMKGYYRAPELSAAALSADGWLNTGDIARRDADGALFIVGRAKELIIRSGFNVYPLEVETILNAHPAVTQSAVVGRGAADGNEEVIAFVEIAPRWRIGAEELRAYLAPLLAPYKCPSEIVMMATLPAAATGKVLKGQLRKLAEEMRRG
ncbi:MAG TPA: AMP-binding protein [Janthinobacterium sp.]|nr:AMP-binding protein [Janthinobacterium sp.]